MIPAMLLVAAGKRQFIWLPLPLFLLWPFWLLAWLFWLPLRLLRSRAELALRAGLLILWRLSGTVVDVAGKDGSRIYFRFI